MVAFCTKPIVVEAWRWDGDHILQSDPDWVAEATEPLGIVGWSGMATVGLSIKTRHGTMRASPGDWLIKWPDGRVTPCKPDVFEATYEAVPNPQGPALLEALRASVKEGV